MYERVLHVGCVSRSRDCHVVEFAHVEYGLRDRDDDDDDESGA